MIDELIIRTCRLNGQLHSIEGRPAKEFENGTKEWYQNGQLHRVDGPAIEMAKTIKVWYQNGQLHRVDGPAIEMANGYKVWCLNGQIQRKIL